MFRLFLIWLCLLIAQFNLAQANDEKLSAAVRDVQNATTADLSVIADGTARQWILAAVKPGNKSGGLIVHSVYIDAATGKLIAAPGKKDVVNVYGTFDVVTVLTDDVAQTTFPYQWELPVPEFGLRWSHNVLDDLLPFRHGGTAVFHIGDGLKEPAKILPIYIVPEEWQQYVAPAVKYYKVHAPLFALTSAKENQDQLRKEVENENPFIALSAARLLTFNNGYDREFISGSLSASRGLSQAALTLLFLRSASSPADNELIEALLQNIAATDDSAHLQGTALGALAALRDADRSTSIVGFRVLNQFEKRQAFSTPQTESDKDIRSIVENAMLPLLRQNPAYGATRQ